MIKWKINKKLLENEDYKVNNNIASKIKKTNLNLICKHYTHITPNNIFFHFK